MRKKNTRRLTSEELCTDTWKHPDEGALSSGAIVEGYRARKRAINLYLEGATAKEIKAKAGIGLSQTIRLIKERCLAVHKDGEVWGWRGLVPRVRINSYQRKRKIRVDQFGHGASGALNAVLNEHPPLREKFINRILSVGKPGRLSVTKRSNSSHWRWFLDQLRELSYEKSNKWPFNTKSLGYVSICRYVKTVLEENPEAAAFVVGGPEIQKKLITGDGRERPTQYIFERIEMDAHKLDGRFSVFLPQPTGGYIQKIVHRLWVIVIIDVISRAVLGYHLSMRKEVSKVDVLRVIKMALTRWKRPEISFSDLAFLPRSNLPSSAAEKFVGVCWDETSVDGSLAETCKHVKQVLKTVVGSELIEPTSGFSARRSKDDRPFIETYFRNLGSLGFQKLSNTTGGKPSDKRGRDPDSIALTSQFQFEYAKELLAVLIANYNATPHSSLGGRTPLEFLEFHTMYPKQPLRYADPHSVSDIVSFRQLRMVHGGYEQGRKPFVYFAHGRYSGDVLDQRYDLVGKKIWVVAHIEDDVRVVRASTQDGQSIGILKVAPPWHKLPHSLEVRNSVASCVSAGKFKINSGQDAIEIFLDFCEQQKNKRLPVHPAYLEARRILTEVAEAMTGRSMLEIAKERRAAEINTSHKLETLRDKESDLTKKSSGVPRKLPAPRKAANN